MINNVIECSGCGVCFAVCPVNAIEQVEKERSVFYFHTNEKCIHCGKCISVCPTSKNLFHKSQNNFLSARTKDNIILKTSSSGGIAYEISKIFIDNNYVVYGAGWNIEKQNVAHMRIESLEQLNILQGSKYVQSEVSAKIYNDIKMDILNRKVLFIGCPCQVAAVRSLTKDHQNLYCLDIVCHGVSSPKLLTEQLKLISDEPVRNISFRDGLNFRLKVTFQNSVFEKNGYDVPYYSLYLNFASLREACYTCRYANTSRVGDLTLGDYVEHGERFSLIVCNSVKGQDILKLIQNDVTFSMQDIKKLKENHAFNQPTYKSDKVIQFTKLYEKYGFEKAYYRTFRMLFFKRKLRKILGNKLYTKLKKIAGK